MFKNIIPGHCTSEIYKIGNVDMPRGTVVVKNYSTLVANKAEDVATEVYFVDFDSQPTGAYSNVDISQYDPSMDVVKANSYAVLKRLVSGIWATDQIDTTDLNVEDYLIAGTGNNAGKLVKATSGKVTPFKYVGPYDDCGHVLHAFEVVEPKTL